MILGFGTDLIEVGRIEESIRKRPRMAEKILTEKELAYCMRRKSPFMSVAARFAAKEAASKALGCGFREFGFHDLEVINDELGKPEIHFYGRALEKFTALGGKKAFISISHTDKHALAEVIIEGE